MGRLWLDMNEIASGARRTLLRKESKVHNELNYMYSVGHQRQHPI